MKRISFIKHLVSMFLAASVVFFGGCFNKPNERGGVSVKQSKSSQDAALHDIKTINGIECVLVKAGTFNMGSHQREIAVHHQDDEMLHKVTLTKDYWISKCQITKAQYKTVIGSNPSDSAIGDNYPVNMVDWNEAVAFCNAVGGRLPTEAEWEFAARGGKLSKGYIYSGSNDLNAVAWYIANSGGTTHPVGQKAPNELGIYDMSGNVWEWCSDWYGETYYNSGSQTDPTGPGSGSYRVFRGGSWDFDALSCRVADRYCYLPSFRDGSLGFRVVFDTK